jgi:RimJ/RimL family protein N-acetyltransferase
MQSSRLRIRPPTPSDAEAVYAYRSLPDVLRFQGWRPQSVAEVAERFAAQAVNPPDQPDTRYPHVLERIPDGVILGDCLFHLLSDVRQVEIGITVAPQFQRQGYALEAIRTMLEYAFDPWGRHRAIASVDPRNLASMTLMRRVGFRQEAHFVQSVWSDGEWTDDVVFGLLATEFRSSAVNPLG